MATSKSSYVNVWGDVQDFEALPQKSEEVRQSLLNSPKRFQAITEREDRSDTPLEATLAQLQGRYFLQHRGCMLIKSTTDLAVLKELLAHVRPATVIELGTFTGGSAVWISDMLGLEGVPCSVYSMDINPALLQDRVREIKPQNVTFLQGDSFKIADTFTAEFLKSLPHPWIVIDDAHENVFGVLEHFARHTVSGDYFIVEDTNPLHPVTLGVMRTVPFDYKLTGNALLEILKEFLTKHENNFVVDSYFTDLLGYNGTSHWHGFIKRVK